MTEIKVRNTIDTELSLTYLGEVYMIGPKETKVFPINVAKQWIIIYQFMDFVSQDESESEINSDENKVKKVVKKK